MAHIRDMSGHYSLATTVSRDRMLYRGRERVAVIYWPAGEDVLHAIRSAIIAGHGSLLDLDTGKTAGANAEGG